MILDARAQVDLIAALKLEALFKLGRLDSVSEQSTAMTVETEILHSKMHDSVQLRHRLAAIRSLALLAQGRTIKIDMAKAASNHSNEAISWVSGADVSLRARR
jgi:hypothetical protein